MHWVQVYDLHQNTTFVEQVQKATLGPTEFGLEPDHGLFGSNEWWDAIAKGDIPTITVRGHISRIYMGSMNDWPEVEVDADGVKTQWARYGADDLYVVGRSMEIQYVLQKWKNGRVVPVPQFQECADYEN